MVSGTAGSRFIVRKRIRISGGGKDLTYDQTFHLVRVMPYYLQMSAGSNAFQILDKKTLAAAADFAFLDMSSTVEGVSFYYVDAASPTSSSPVVGPTTRYLRPCEFDTSKFWSVGSRPAIVLSNPTDNAAFVTLIYGAYV